MGEVHGHPATIQVEDDPRKVGRQVLECQGRQESYLERDVTTQGPTELKRGRHLLRDTVLTVTPLDVTPLLPLVPETCGIKEVDPMGK